MAKLSVDQALLKAKSHAKKGEIEEAQKLYQAVLQAFPKNKRAQQGLAALNTPKQPATTQGPAQDTINQLINLYNQGQLAPVVEQAKALTEQYPESFIIWNILGAANKGLGRVQAASEAFKKVTELNPTYADGYSNLGICLQDQGKLEEAIASFNKALSIKPDYAEAYNNMGAILQGQGKLEESIASLNKALSLKPDYADAYNNMGNTLKDQGKLGEAIEAYKKALAIKPDHADAVENSFGLTVQLLPVIGNHGYDFDTSETQGHSEIVLRPKYQIQNAIKAYLEADFSTSHSHNQNFRACDRKLLGRLKPQDKDFCNAYSSFIGKLLDANWSEEPTSENKVYHLGESHSLSYAHRNITISGSNFRIVPRMTFGAKAFHFARSKYDSFKAITKAHFVSLPKRSKVFLSYGEIDCRPNEGFITAARKLDQSLEELIDQTTEGYVKWFLEQNADQMHSLYFVGVPAPVYDEKLTTDLNSEVARTVVLFNAALKKYSLQHGFDTVDVFKFTVGKEGFSNGLFHIDNHHLGARSLLEIERQLS